MNNAVDQARTMFGAGQAANLSDLLADDVELRPPTYGKPWRGRQLVAKLLGFAAEAFGGLTYTDHWVKAGRHVLRFEGAIAGEAISGVDVVELDENGLISVFEVFARPPKAILLLRDAMGERVRADSEAMRLMGLDGS